MRKQILTLLGLLICPLLNFANPAENFQLDKQYKQITAMVTSPIKIEVPKGKITVTEFFSYGCPWCFHLEPALETWLKTKPGYVEFERVPVVFENGWDVYSKAYYTAKALGVSDKITPALFDAIHKQGLNLTSDTAIEKFFIEQGIKKQDFDSAYNFSPAIGVEMQRANALMMAYKIFEVPAIIINGKYLVNAAMNKGNDAQVIKVVNYLIAKENSNK